MASRLLTNNTAKEGRTAGIVTNDETTSVRGEASTSYLVKETGTSVASEQDQYVNENSVQSHVDLNTVSANTVEATVNIEDTYNRIEFKNRKEFSVDPGYGTLNKSNISAGNPNYTHIGDVTPTLSDTYSHLTSPHSRTTTLPRGDENGYAVATEDAYSHLSSVSRMTDHRVNIKRLDDEYSHIGQVADTRSTYSSDEDPEYSNKIGRLRSREDKTSTPETNRNESQSYEGANLSLSQNGNQGNEGNVGSSSVADLHVQETDTCTSKLEMIDKEEHIYCNT